MTADVRKKALEENKENLRKGNLNDDSLVKPEYNEYYADFKGSLSTYKANFGVPDLYVTGNFYESFEVNSQDTILDFYHNNSVSYANYLVSRYSENIFGLNDQSKDIVSLAYIDNLLKTWKKILN